MMIKKNRRRRRREEEDKAEKGKGNKKKLPVKQFLKPVTHDSASLQKQTACISAATSTEGNMNSRTAGSN